MKKKEPTALDTFKRLKQVPLDVTFIDYMSVEMEDVCSRDYPDFCDAYISYAEFQNGTPLTEDELERLNDDHPDVVYEAAVQNVYG